MARRKKEPEGYHSAQIAQAAGRLFAAQGVARTTMDEVAKQAGYSKATVYVHFPSKEALVGELALESMRLLHEHLCAAVAAQAEPKGRFFAICDELVRYQAQYPYYFETVLGEISIDFEGPDSLPATRETFAVGEEINAEIAAVLRGGMDAGVFRADLQVPETVFQLWAAMSGLVLLGANKQAYIETVLHLPTEVFLRGGFALLYRTIAKEG